MIAGAILLAVIIVGYVQVRRLRKRVKAIEDAAPTLDERKQWEAAVRKILGS